MSLGRLQKVGLRSIWETEDRDFTPWLAKEQNIELLAKTLGLNLEVEAQEKPVGPFRADILCKDLDEEDDHWILIENQIEKTDHKHLGQLMTYAAGLQAVTIIWIASQFTDEHRAALDWLNRITDEDFRFFGLEVELWKIGDSPAAPKFNIVSKPNEWSRTVSAATRAIKNQPLTETKLLQLEFWNSFAEKLSKHPSLRMQKPRPQHWCNISIGRSGVKLGGLLNTKENRLGVEFYASGSEAFLIFQGLRKQQNAIEKELGFSPEWRELPNKQASRIVTFSKDSPLDNKSRWDEYQNWMFRTLDAFNDAFRQRVLDLELDEIQYEIENSEN